MDKILKLCFLMMVLVSNAFGQKGDIMFLKEKNMLDYPGFAAKTNENDFNRLVDLSMKKYNGDTFKIMGNIVDFFQDRHLDLVLLKSAVVIDSALCKKKVMNASAYLNGRSKKKKYDGYWINDYNDCVMALIEEGAGIMKGYVVESRDSAIYYPGMEAFAFDLIGKNQFFTKYTSNYSGNMFYIRSSFRNDSTLITGANGKWRKLAYYHKPIINSFPKFDYTATASRLDSNTFLITIPISNASNTKIVDSIVKANAGLLGKTENLIIDIRQNLGGTVRTYLPLMPFIYTRPIEKINVAVYCSKDVIVNTKENIDDYIKNGQIDSAFLKKWNDLLKMEEDSIGKFISGNGKILKYDTVMEYPKNVGIIINYANQSAAEIMLLDCRQSSKVKLFGEHTRGAIDYLDYYPLDFPAGKYQLKIASTKRIIPAGGTKLDGIGIHPDVEITDSQKNWVQFVKEYYEDN